MRRIDFIDIDDRLNLNVAPQRTSEPGARVSPPLARQSQFSDQKKRALRPRRILRGPMTSQRHPKLCKSAVANKLGSVRFVARRMIQSHISNYIVLGHSIEEEKAIHHRSADQNDRRWKLASHSSHRSCLERHGLAIIRIQSTPFKAQSIDVDLHVHLPAMGKLPVPTGFGDLSQLGISVKRLCMRRRPLAAKEVAGDVRGVLHGYGRSGEEGPDIVDFLIVKGNGDVVKPDRERSMTSPVFAVQRQLTMARSSLSTKVKGSLHQVAATSIPCKLLTRKELRVDSRLHDSTLTSQEREQSRRVTHTVQIDQILVSPVLAQRDGVGKSMILSHTVTSTGVLGASDSLGERDVHDVGVQVAQRNGSFDPVVASRRISKDNVLGNVGGIRGHFDESLMCRSAMILDRRVNNLPVTLILRQETGRVGSTTGGGTSPEDVVNLLGPGHLHIVDFFDDHVLRIPTIRVSLGRRIVVMTGNQDIAVSDTLGGTEHWVKRLDRSPITEEVSLLVVSPRVAAEIELVVGAVVEIKVRGERLIDSGLGKRREGLLSLLEHVSFRAEESTGLRVRIARTAEGFPDIAVALPIRNKLSSENMLNALCIDKHW